VYTDNIGQYEVFLDKTGRFAYDYFHSANHHVCTTLRAAEEAILRVIEILELGQEMRRQARAGGAGVNASLFLVHEVMLGAFDDPSLRDSANLQTELASRLKRKLRQRDIGHRVSL
jgi:hypothetical protein